ncbi:unnamed protein product [Boreogadus saida]
MADRTCLNQMFTLPVYVYRWNMEKPTHQCTVCDKTFGLKSDLARHLKIHAIARETFTCCDVCGKSLATKPSLVSHQQLHQYPNIILYRQGEARLYCTEAARSVAGARSSTVVDPKWLDLKTAETFGKYCHPEAPALPTSLPPPERPQVQYRHIHHEAGKRRGEKRRSVFLWARWLCHRQQLPGTVLPSPLPPTGPPPSPATHHGTTTVSSQKSSHQMNLHLRGPSNNQHTTIHHPLSRVPPHSIQTLDSNLSHSQPPQGDNPPRRRTGVTSGLAKNLRAMMKGPTKVTVDTNPPAPTAPPYTTPSRYQTTVYPLPDQSCSVKILSTHLPHQPLTDTTAEPTPLNSYRVTDLSPLLETPHDTFTTQPDNIPTDSTKHPAPHTDPGLVQSTASQRICAA